MNPLHLLLHILGIIALAGFVYSLLKILYTANYPKMGFVKFSIFSLSINLDIKKIPGAIPGINSFYYSLFIIRYHLFFIYFKYSHRIIFKNQIHCFILLQHFYIFFPSKR